MKLLPVICWNGVGLYVLSLIFSLTINNKIDGYIEHVILLVLCYGVMACFYVPWIKYINNKESPDEHS